MMKAYLVRHGETDYNRQSVYFGWSDVPLNKQGCRQAAALAAELAEIKFDAVWSSPLIRAVETARLIIGERQTEIVRLPGLKEINFGKWEAMSYYTVEHDYPKEWQEWEKAWESFVIPEGESFQQFYHRVIRAWQLIKKQAAVRKCNNFLCTAHGGVIKAILLYEGQRDLDDFWKITVEHGKAVEIVLG